MKDFKDKGDCKIIIKGKISDFAKDNKCNANFASLALTGKAIKMPSVMELRKKAIEDYGGQIQILLDPKTGKKTMEVER